MIEAGYLIPPDGSVRGIVVYDSGLCDGVCFCDMFSDWEVELTRRFPKVYVVTENEGLFCLVYNGSRSEPKCEAIFDEALTAIDILRALKVDRSRILSLGRIFAMSYKMLFDELYD
ncbi:hypothetical protein [Brevibacterium luteolum]|uniref:hypothetical protein n=1 Tax=Brevibacterium luteolum TaxID=199591 RepID=UPI0011AFA387|nr:hypothetical protein [Brevibacterium luteolum]